MVRKRISTLLLFLGTIVLVAWVSWVAGQSIQSPAEVAARTAPPTPAPILVPVEERVLTADVVTRGTARYGRPHTVSIPPSTLKEGASIITLLPQRAAQLVEGDVLLSVSGRPLLLLQGETPAYRDLFLGLSGEDVRQLENSLARLGFDPGDVDGAFDEQTGRAVAALYEAAGRQLFAATDAQRAQIHKLEQQLADAVERQINATDAVTTAALAVNSARAQAKSANIQASATATVVENTDSTLALAQMEAIELAGQVSVQRALDTQHAAERVARRAADEVTSLTTELAQTRQRTRIQIPVDEIVFVPSLPARVEELHVEIGNPAVGSVLTLTDNQLAIDSSLPLNEAALVQTGMPVSIDEPELGLKATGTVERVAASPGTDGVDGYHVYFETSVDITAASLEGVSLRLTIPVQSTGERVLAVPVSALSLTGDGTSRLTVARGAEHEFVEIEPGLSADGFVAVSPVNGTLTPGELVVIGYE